MVNYVKREKELSMYCIESIKILCKPAIILSLIALPLSVYYLVVGYVVDSEALILGYSSLVIFAESIIYITVTAIRVKSRLLKSFKESIKNGMSEFNITFVDDTYIINNISMGVETKIKKEEIKKIRKTKKIIMVKLQTNVVHLFPNKVEIREIFEKT